MELLYAALLLHRLGKPINEAAIKKVLESAGASVDDAKIRALTSALADVDIEKVIKEASMPVATGAPTQQAAKPEAKEEKKEEKKAEEAAAGLSSLFG